MQALELPGIGSLAKQPLHAQNSDLGMSCVLIFIVLLPSLLIPVYMAQYIFFSYFCPANYTVKCGST